MIGGSFAAEAPHFDNRLIGDFDQIGVVDQAVRSLG
jgi:hypothetical protein